MLKTMIHDYEWHYYKLPNKDDYRILFVIKGNEGYLFWCDDLREEEAVEIVEKINWKS